MSLLTPAQKAALSADLDAGVSTFLRPTVIYLAAQTVSITLDDNYNRFNAVDQNNLTPENVPVQYTINARIQYGSRQNSPFAGLGTINAAESQIKIKNPEGEVRLKVDASGAALLKNVKQLELDGSLFNLDSTQRPHGLFSGTYATFWFQRVI